MHDSRSTAFAGEILDVTGGRGVDVVLNSLAGPFVDASFRCLTRGGRFLEIGKRDVWSPQRASAERPDASYYFYDLGSEAERDRQLFRSLLETLRQRLTEGSIRPLPVVSYPLRQAAEAMRTMAQARHIGKLAIRCIERPKQFRASPEASYWITGGLGGLGLETADWLCRSGARSLVLSSRGAPGKEASRRIQAWRDAGVDVRLKPCDVGDAASVEGIFRRIAETMPPLRGIVHAAGVLRDGTLANQTWPEARLVLNGKAHGALHLHRLSQGLDLDFFILYSAGALLLGGAGQGLYPAANAELDALARHRKAAGLPALSVAWGLWSGVGMAAGGADATWKARGLVPLIAGKAFADLERLLASGMPHGAILPIDWARFMDHAPAGLDRSYFNELLPASGSDARPARSVTEQISPLQMIRVSAPAQRREKLLSFLRDRTAQMLGLDSTVAINARQPLKEVGIDSLMAVELRNLLVRAGGHPLPATLLFDYPTLDALSGFLMTAWSLGDRPVPEKTEDKPSGATPEIEALSDTEIEDLLRKELAMSGGAT